MSQPSKEVLAVKRAVRLRDGNCCSSCGTTEKQHLRRCGRRLEVHRIVPGSLYTEEGCVTLCKRCHADKPKRKRGQPDLADSAPTVFRLGKKFDDLIGRLAQHFSATAVSRCTRTDVIRIAVYEMWLAECSQKDSST